MATAFIAGNPQLAAFFDTLPQFQGAKNLDFSPSYWRSFHGENDAENAVILQWSSDRHYSLYIGNVMKLAILGERKTAFITNVDGKLVLGAWKDMPRAAVVYEQVA